MDKKLQVLVVFEFNGIDDPDSVEAEIAIEGLSEMLDPDNRTGYIMLEEAGASAAWIQNAMVVESNNG